MKESSVELKDTVTSKTSETDSQNLHFFFKYYFNITFYIIKYGTDRASDRCYELYARIYT